MEDAKQLLTTYMSDMLSLERLLLETVDRQAQDPQALAFAEASDLFNRLAFTLRRHMTSLDANLAGTGGKTRARLKETVSSLAGIAVGMIDGLRTHPVSKMLRDDYTALGLIAISYTMLHSAALGFRDTATAELALQHLEEITPFIVQISELIPAIVIKELAQEFSAVDGDSAAQALTNTHKTWAGIKHSV